MCEQVFSVITNFFEKKLFQFSIAQMGSAAGATHRPFKLFKIKSSKNFSQQIFWNTQKNVSTIFQFTSDRRKDVPIF